MLAILTHLSPEERSEVTDLATQQPLTKVERSEEKEETKRLRVCGEIFIRPKRSSKLKDRTTRERGDDALTPDLQMTDTVAVATQ